MKQILPLFFLFVLALPMWSPSAGKAASRLIVVDASHDGGTWWYPQSPKSHDPTKDHQGKRFADALRLQGYVVSEIHRGTRITDQFKDAEVVIRFACWGTYEPTEVEAYQRFAHNGGKVLLIQGFIRKDAPIHDDVANTFGITFDGEYRTKTFVQLADHPLTRELALPTYQTGSAITRMPPEALPLAFIENAMPVMGRTKVGNGEVIFVSSIFPFINNKSPLGVRLVRELATQSSQ
jgi:hypothetical protein